ncbi:hypothetical protein DFP72DRAFT_904266 [Ephemerocybe angulata]|uniref:F-box domain-containing protein n=1 Tax=Ephemerocybe angulata TaxID=980116 RepID=A0A8H6M224_9AGAR|nr:hypothetical protein DFP72DRAFT_904266 [Tulosesus angulatus]
MPIRPRSNVRQDTIIPYELWCEAFAHSEPSDVLSLGQTCKALHALVAQRSIWITILASICARHALFAPSYPLHDMDLAQLQRAAMRPNLLQRRMKNHALPGDRLNEARELGPVTILDLNQLRTSPENDGAEWSFHRHLVPGGRFLVQVRYPRASEDGMAITAQGPFSATLWDLGVPSSAPLSKPILMGAKDLGEYVEPVVSVVSSYTGASKDILRVAIELGNSDEDRLVVILLSVSLRQVSHDDLVFQDLGMIRVTGGVQDELQEAVEPIIRGDLMLIRLTWNFVIWNFVADTYIVISTGIDLPEEQFVFTGKLVILFVEWWKKRGIRTWKVPSSESFKDVTSHSIVAPFDGPPTPPDHILPLPYPAFQNYTSISVNVPRGSLDLPFSFDVFSSPRLKGYAARRGKMTPRTPTRGMRCTLDNAKPSGEHHSDNMNELALVVEPVLSFSLNPPVTGPPLPLPQFATAMSDGNLTYAFMASTMKEYALAGGTGKEYGVFAYTLVPTGALPAPSAGPSSRSGESTVGQAASVEVVRLTALPQGSFQSGWAACAASGRLVDKDGPEDTAVLLDYLA